MSGLDETIATMVRDAVAEAVAPLTKAVTELHEKVTAERRIYGLHDLWIAIGGPRICTFDSFRHRKDLPEADSRNGKHLAYSRSTFEAWLQTMSKPKRSTTGRRRSTRVAEGENA